MERASGVLLPIFSLPSKYGIGCFSKEAYQFIDRLKAAGAKLLADSSVRADRIRRFSVSVFFYICRQSVFYRS